ncbi:MAG: polysaccharide biosynthesis protein [Magnetococcales bacterium]|nr:polysaccharide biosynthesis protein [Magnetococcales bacterium]
MLSFLLDRPRRVKQILLMLFDTLAILLGLWGAFAIRYEVWVPDAMLVSWANLPLSLAISLPVFHRLGLYRPVIRYLESQAVFSILKAIVLSVGLTLIASVSLGIYHFSLSVWGVNCLIQFFLVGGSRMLARHILTEGGRKRRSRVPVAIYGAGTAGVQLAMALRHSPEVHPLFFVDDKLELHNHEILGMGVHPPQELPRLIERFGVQRVLLAIPSLSRARRSRILQDLEKLSAQILVAPPLEEIASGRKRLEDVTQVGVDDLLGRNPVPPNQMLLETCIRDKCVMVTGAGGSIGSELCRKIIQLGPSSLVLVDRSEFALYQIDGELRRILAANRISLELVPILGSTEHATRMRSVIDSFGVQTIYHAAAYKHVPIIERNPIEGVQNNIFGTWHLARAALEERVETFVLVSTDKAVRPTNVMGATKRFGELIIQALAQEHPGITRFIAVRFGNVLASSGSVVPLFQEQIRRGGPVTVTDPRVERFFMTIPEAAELVIQAGSMGSGGDVFVLNMGDPIRIDTFARRMIHLAGLTVRDADNPKGDIEILYTGLREGEKLFEELLYGDNLLPTEHEMILHAREDSLPLTRLEVYLDRLAAASKGFDYLGIRDILLESVQGYQPTGGIQDWVWIRKAQ